MGNTILSVEVFINGGMPVSSDITEAEIGLKIRSFEHFYLKPILTADVYSAIVTNADHAYDNVIHGDDTLAGLEIAIMHGVYALMLYDTLRLTRYGSVRKDTNESENPERDDILAVCKQNFEICQVFVSEVCKYLDVHSNKNHYNSFIFNELVC